MFVSSDDDIVMTLLLLWIKFTAHICNPTQGVTNSFKKLAWFLKSWHFSLISLNLRGFFDFMKLYQQKPDHKFITNFEVIHLIKTKTTCLCCLHYTTHPKICMLINSYIQLLVLHDINNFHAQYIITYLSQYYYISR